MGLFSRKKKEYELENAALRNKQNPRNFLVPSSYEIKQLLPGALVRLHFVLATPAKDGCRAERMWVRITGVPGALFTGELDSAPCYIKSLHRGDTIHFEAHHIATILTPNSPFDEKQLSIISKKALENRQVNWVVRSEDRNNDRDSGWQLFSGDESPEYLADAANATIITLDRVLSFEPLLEEAFAGNGFAYAYSKEQNKFIETQL